jgi:hypothetical protein
MQDRLEIYHKRLVPPLLPLIKQQPILLVQMTTQLLSKVIDLHLEKITHRLSKGDNWWKKSKR